ncbi:MAG: hypothetical protein K6G79_00470 [Bacteroidales bacterium]|nr:hypothetical protein [Bacteroidales bacterium]
MCRRSVGSVIPFLFVFLSAGAAHAQASLPESVISLVEQLSGEEGGAESLMYYYEALLEHPLNLNAATRAELEETGLMTLFQIESLMAWRQRYGAVRSSLEWALVEGFSPESVAQIEPFFTLGEPSPVTPVSTDITAKMRKKWRQEGFSVTTKAFHARTGLEAGIILDNDPRERFPDFASASARWKGFYAGDFTARFGQGLVMWKAFGMNAFGTPSSMARRGTGLQCYRSAGESGFLRGAAWAGKAGRLNVAALVSRTPVDARISGEGSYTSIYTDGIHVSEAEKARRHAMHEQVAAARVSCELGRWQIGLTAAAYGYDHPNGRPVQEYNRPQQYDGPWGNVGVDWYGSLESLRLFGEAALDAHGAPAVVAGAVWSPDYGFEAGLTARCYAPSYIATHAGAWSTMSTVSNQLGATAALQWRTGRWTLAANADICHYPWKRYRAEAGTWSFKGRLLLQHSFRGGTLAEAQASLSSGRPKVRLKVTVPAGSRLTFEIRGDMTPGGVAGYAGVGWKPSDKWSLYARFTAWHTDGWDSRIVYYEQGVSQSFPVETYSGKGTGEYLVVKYSPSKRFEMQLKLQQGYCAYFVRIFIPGRMMLLAFKPLSL